MKWLRVSSIEICSWLLIRRIYVDIVINHMTGDHATAVGVGGSTADTYNLQYPAVPFGPNDFNQPQCGIDNYEDPNNVCNEGKLLNLLKRPRRKMAFEFLTLLHKQSYALLSQSEGI